MTPTCSGQRPIQADPNGGSGRSRPGRSLATAGFVRRAVSFHRVIIRRFAKVRNIEKKAEIGRVGDEAGSGKSPRVMKRNHGNPAGSRPGHPSHSNRRGRTGCSIARIAASGGSGRAPSCPAMIRRQGTTSDKGTRRQGVKPLDRCSASRIPLRAPWGPRVFAERIYQIDPATFNQFFG
jgi:hypothetical protein